MCEMMIYYSLMSVNAEITELKKLNILLKTSHDKIVKSEITYFFNMALT